MFKFYFFILCYTFLSSLAALFLKKAANKEKKLSQLIFFDNFLYIGGFLYLIASIGSIIALKYLPYSTVYFLSSFTYVWSILLAKFYLNEQIDSNKIISICFIVSGVLLISI